MPTPQRALGTPPSVADLALYFLRLGAVGFGGPAALADRMRRDLVERRRWISEDEYERGLAIAAACPGPMAFQLGVFCGHARRGIAGALAVAVAFALVPFLLVTLLAATYQRFASTAPLRGLFYGVGPVVVALVVKACWGLARKTLRRDPAAWAAAAVAAAITAALERELPIVFLAFGLLGAFLFPRADSGPPPDPTPTPAPPPATVLGLALPVAALAAPGSIAALFWFFFKTGCLVFGSGLVIVPLLHRSVVDEFLWLTEREFVDAVAVGMASPGPVVITATFVGFIVAGLGGALAATAGIFSPAVLFTVVAAPLVRRHGRHPRLAGFVRGVTVAVVGVLAGTTPMVARAVLVDAPSVVIAASGLVVLALAPRLPEPALVLAGALFGWAVRALP